MGTGYLHKLAITKKDDDDGANATRFRIRWDAQPAAANNTFVVTIEKDTPGSFHTPRKDLGVTETLQEFPVIINGEEATLIRLDIMGVVPS